MATRALNYQQNALIRTYGVPTGKATTLGLPVKLSGADDQVEVCAAGEDGIGVALSTQVAGDQVQVALYGWAIVPVKVGTGGATRGLWAKSVADGFTDLTTGGGSTARYAHGKFLQSGVVGDLVGLLLANSPTVSA